MRSKLLFLLGAAIGLAFFSCGATEEISDTFRSWFKNKETELLTRRLSLVEYEDKLRGAWAGKMIGVSYAAPYEFKYLGQIMEDPIRDWRPEYIANALRQDDLYVQLTFLEVLQDKGQLISAEEAAEFFADTKYPLWHANQIARANLRAGIRPPDSGHPRYNPHADDIDFQIEADVFGILCPGMPHSAEKLAAPFGRTVNYGDGVYGGLFVARMYTAAYFEKEIEKVIRFSLYSLPPESQYARVIRDVIDYHKENPSNWRGCWKRLEEKWGAADFCPEGYQKPYNIDAKLNGGYAALGLLYGEGDFFKTLEITTRCGQDSDCNASTALGILGAIQGYSRIPNSLKVGLPLISHREFLHTKYSFTTLIRSCKQVTQEIVERYGGRLIRLGEREYFDVPIQSPPPPPRLEQYTEGMFMKYREQWGALERERLQRLQRKLQSQLNDWAKGWSVSQCGLGVNPGLRKEYYDRFSVFTTIPQNKETPCILSWRGRLPGGAPKLHIVTASSDYTEDADFLLRIRLDGQVIHEETLGWKEGKVHWHDMRIDLSAYADRQVEIALENAENGDSHNAAYWATLKIEP